MVQRKLTLFDPNDAIPSSNAIQTMRPCCKPRACTRMRREGGAVFHDVCDDVWPRSMEMDAIQNRHAELWGRRERELVHAGDALVATCRRSSSHPTPAILLTYLHTALTLHAHDRDFSTAERMPRCKVPARLAKGYVWSGWQKDACCCLPVKRPAITQPCARSPRGKGWPPRVLYAPVRTPHTRSVSAG
jgi:hypothetical protein